MTQNTIRAIFDDTTVRVYQAYRAEIAMPALAAGRFVPPFSMNRMTWIKPSFNWMMYRSGFACKVGQEVILGIDITRAGFEWALANAVLSSFTPGIHLSHEAWRSEIESKPVRVQWDPERNWRAQPIEGVRAIQIGLSGDAVERYVHDWVVRIEDVTPIAKAALHSATIPTQLPSSLEQIYPLPADLVHICRD